MNNIKKIGILLIIGMLILSAYICPVYADTSSTDKQDLINMLNQYKSQLGDLNELKVIVDKLYSDVNSATTVDDQLKATLKEDLNKLDTVTGINPLVLTVLKSELSAQIDELTDSKLPELKEEVGIIKEWVDEQVQYSNKDDNNNNNDGNNNNNNNSNDNNANDSKNENTTNNNSTTNNAGDNKTPNTNKNTGKTNTTQIPGNKSNSLSQLPYTGTGRTMIVLFVALIIGMVASFIKYNKYKEIK